jgi:hypothetical protein
MPMKRKLKNVADDLLEPLPSVFFVLYNPDSSLLGQHTHTGLNQRPLLQTEKTILEQIAFGLKGKTSIRRKCKKTSKMTFNPLRLSDKSSPSCTSTSP